MLPKSGSRRGWNLPSERIEFIVAITFLVLQPLVFYRAVLFNPRSSIPFDIEAFHLPLASYIGRCVREGVFPFWNPYPYCGVPIHADLQAQLFYPFTWIAILLGNLSSGHKLLYWLEWLVPLHMILAGLFTFFLLRQLRTEVPAALLGGTVYQLGGFFASQAQHLGAVCCAAWLPLALLSVLKLSRDQTPRWTAMLSLSVALSILAGFPAAILVVLAVTAVSAVALFLRGGVTWKFLAYVAGGFALGTSITALQTIPTYQLARVSIAFMRSQWGLTGGGLRIQSLASLFAPNYYHIFTPFDPSLFKLPTNFTLLYVYCGIIPLGLVVAAAFLRRERHARTLCAFTVLSAIWMLGDSTPAYRFMYSHMPPLLRGALYPEYALIAFSMFMALTGAVALSAVARFAPRWLIWAIALSTAVDLIYFGSGRPMNSMPGSYKNANSEYQLQGDPDGLTTIQKLVNGTIPPLRIDYLDTDRWPFTWGSDMFRLPTANGYNPLMLRRMYSLRRLFGGIPAEEREIPVKRFDSPLINMLNIGFLAGHAAASLDEMERAGVPEVLAISALHFYRNPDALPRFFLVHRLHISTGPDDTFSYVARPDFSPREEAVVETKDLRPEVSLADGTVSVEQYSANRVELRAVASGPGFLASSDTLYPGWTATVNGKPARLYMTNGAFRGLALGPGTNRIVMTYWPPGFLLWIAVSATSLLLAIAGLVFGSAERNGAK
ncbi:MAG TPA: YfhO family protein [Bryobacteraceae bacterium]|nr:YfhO family protein [Bryobacteraceae bacterium]